MTKIRMTLLSLSIGALALSGVVAGPASAKSHHKKVHVTKNAKVIKQSANGGNGTGGNGGSGAAGGNSGASAATFGGVAASGAAGDGGRGARGGTGVGGDGGANAVADSNNDTTTDGSIHL